MKKTGDLPADFVLEDVGDAGGARIPPPRACWRISARRRLNLPVDLTLPQIAAIRQAIDVAIDFYVESPDDFGGGVRHYEIPELVRVAAPIYLKYGLRNSPGLYPSGQHHRRHACWRSRASACGAPPSGWACCGATRPRPWRHPCRENDDRVEASRVRT